MGFGRPQTPLIPSRREAPYRGTPLTPALSPRGRGGFAAPLRPLLPPPACGRGRGRVADRGRNGRVARTIPVPTGLSRPAGPATFARMTLNYSVSDARARFSEVIRHVREGRTVTVSCRGEPVAEIRPVERREERTLEERLDDLRRKGCLVPAASPGQPLRPVARRPGALARFLAGRGE